MDRADEERLIHAAGSQLWAKAAHRTASSINKPEPNPHFKEKNKKQQRKFVIVNPAIFFNFSKAPEISVAIYPL